MNRTSILTTAVSTLVVGGLFFAVDLNGLIVVGLWLFLYFSITVILDMILGTRHEMRYGTHTVPWQYCPTCDDFMPQQTDTWIPRCKKCGHKSSGAGRSWLTQSVPSRHLRRSLTLFRSSILIAGLLVFAVGVSVGGIHDVNEEYNVVETVDAVVVGGHSVTDNESTDNNSTGAWAAGDLDAVVTKSAATNESLVRSHTDNISASDVETHVLKEINGYRNNTLLKHTRLTEQAQGHADDMASHGYFAHESQSGFDSRFGVTVAERYWTCDAPGEMLYQTWVDQPVPTEDGDTVTYTSSEELAEGIVDGLMHSASHREDGIFDENWMDAGVGVSITDAGKVYVVVGLCSW